MGGAGSVDGAEQALALVEAGGAWAAVLWRRRERLRLLASGRGPAPERLDLREYRGG